MHQLPRTPPDDPFRNAAERAALRPRAQRRRAAGEDAPPRPEAPSAEANFFERRFAEQQAIETTALAYHQAKLKGAPLPAIEDGIVRGYATVMGQTITWRDGAPTLAHRRVHESAIASFHDCIRQWQAYRQAHGLPIGLTMDQVHEAVAALCPQERMAVTRRLHQPKGTDPA